MNSIECLTVSIGYGDFLQETLPLNLPLVDRMLVVTSPKDERTRDICWKLNVEVLLTEETNREGREFDKARIIDRGLQLLSHQDWLLHIDSDIALPPHFRKSLNFADLDVNNIYGCDRINVKGRQRWERFKISGFLNRYSRCNFFNVCFPDGYTIGARWADPFHGYVPIGFFQLWHRDAEMFNGMRQRRYTSFGHNDAARTDCQFALQWDRKNRVLLPEIVVAHLESDGATVGANWCGRTTASFDLISNESNNSSNSSPS